MHDSEVASLRKQGKGFLFLSLTVLMLSGLNPMSHSSRLEVLQIKPDQLKAGLVEIGDMRPGSLAGGFRKCGKLACPCAGKDAPGHGPCYSLTQVVEGKAVTGIIPKGAAVERTRQQIAEEHRFRDLVRELIGVSEQICDTQIH